MKTITVTEAKRSLGSYLKQASRGEDIGIVSGAEIFSLRKVDVVAADRVATAKVMKSTQANDWPEFPTFDGGPVDGALNHDKYLYDEPAKKQQRKSRK